MKTRNLLFISLIVSGSVFYTSCGSGSTKPETAIGTEAPKDTTAERTRLVRTTTIAETEISRDIDYSANLIANEEVYFAPATPGRIIKIGVEVGDRVKAGQLLVQMDPTQLNTTELQLMSLEKDMERFDTLIRYGSITQQQYDQMKTQVDVTRANYELLKTNTNMTSPFSGVITGKYFENGELYSGSPNTAAGKAAIVTIQQTNPIKALISMSEKYFPVVKTGMRLELTTEIYQGQVFAGTISLIHPTINAATKTFDVEIQIPNEREILRPGMYARVKMELGKDKGIVVPANTVVQQIGTNDRYIFLNKNGIAERINVQLGKRFDEKVEIISNQIKIGDQLIIVGHGNLNNGTPVQVVTE